MPTPEEFNARISNLVSVLEAMKARVEAILTLTARELEEIGSLTIRLAALEESISLYCQVLLVRPELGGFHPHNKAVAGKQLTEKLTLFKSLITASGVLYGIRTEAIEGCIVAIKEMGEDRNAIVHGMLCKGRDGERAFHIRGRDVSATLEGLRSLIKRCERRHAN